MTWRKWVYIISLVIVWGFLISGALIRKEQVTSKRILDDMKKNWSYWLLCTWFPQMLIMLVIIQIIFDFNGFKQMVAENYKI